MIITNITLWEWLGRILLILRYWVHPTYHKKIIFEGKIDKNVQVGRIPEYLLKTFFFTACKENYHYFF